MFQSPMVQTPVNAVRHVSKSKYVSPTRSPHWLRLGLSLLLGGLFTFTQYGSDDPLDVFVCASVYAAWLIYCLPGLYKKLNIQMVWAVVLIVLRLYFADIVFRGYRTVRRFFNGSVPAFDPFGDVVNQLWIIGVMSGFRIVVITYCIGVSLYRILNKRYFQHLRRSERKMV